MTRRAVWLSVLHLVIPGSAQTLAGNRRLGRFALGLWLLGWVALVAAVLLGLLLPQALLTLPSNAVGLTVLQALLVIWAVVWALLTLDTVRLLRLVRVLPVGRAVVGGLFAIALVVGLGGAGWGVWAAGVARSTVSTVFGSGLYRAPSAGRYNILLLGGDAGKGRSGLRPDSISVVSVDALTGKMVTVGLPRDLDEIPFVKDSPMRALYPNGYGTNGRCNVDVCQLNSIYTEAQLKEQQRYPDAAKQHSSAGIEATREAVEGALGITVQYYVLIDMGNFDKLIDAMGGVTIDVTQRIPLGGHIVNGRLTGVKVWIEKGVRHLNGNRALWYARSRYGDVEGDYGRMKRQRQLEEAILHQIGPATILTRFQGITSTAADTVSTDIPQGLLGELAGAAVKSRSQQVTTIELVPPLVTPSAPDYPKIRALVQRALA